MRRTVRIYDPSVPARPSRPIATLVLGDRRERACWLPERVAAEARFFLEQIETESEDVKQRIRAVLQQPFVVISKSSAHVTGAVRTRGDYLAREPYGTPAYWRAAIGRLESEAGLTEDLEDYGRMLQEMEAGVPIRVEPGSAETYAVVHGTVSTPHGEVPIEFHVGKGIKLAAALKRLELARQDLRDRLVAWREQVERGAAAAEAALRAVLPGERAGTVEVLPAMSHPSLQATYAGAGIRGGRGETMRKDQGAGAVVITTNAVPGAHIAVVGDEVIVTFVNWQAPTSPLLVLVPDDELSEPRTPDRLEREDDKWTARFERVPAGTYLLALAPVSE